MNILSLKRGFGDLKRLREIITILVEEGFHAHLANAKLARHAKVTSRIRHGAKRKDLTPERARKALEKLGPTFVKLGQVLSLRPDLIPHEYCEEFRKLQDDAPPVRVATIRRIIEEELKKSIGKVFKSFSNKPIGSASIAQVHEAVLLDGTRVVVKVQRPDIIEIMERDIDIMSYIAEKTNKQIKNINTVDVVEEFKIYTNRELDFNFELRNVKKFYRYFKKDDHIVIPQAHDKLSTSKILVLEYIDGIKGTDRDSIVKAKYNLKELMRLNLHSLLQQAFDLGVFHADLHPGNLIILKKKNKPAIAIIDYGIVGFIEPSLQRELLEFLNHLVNGDISGVKRAILNIGEAEPGLDHKTLEHKLAEMVMDWQGTDLQEASMSQLFYNIIITAADSGVKMPTNVILLAKAFVTIEGGALYFDPTFNVAEEVKPFLGDLLSKHFGPKRLKEEVLNDIPEAEKFIKDFPRAAETIMGKIKEGKIEMHIDSSEFSSIARDYDLEMNRRNYVLLGGTLFIGSALLAGFAPDLYLLRWPLYSWGFAGFAATLVLFLHASMKIHKYLEQGEE